MKHSATVRRSAIALAPFALAAFLAVGTSGAALGAHFEAFGADVIEAGPGASASGLEHPYHHCHGMTSGTAHPTCGTRTGGPSGGLF